MTIVKMSTRAGDKILYYSSSTCTFSALARSFVRMFNVVFSTPLFYLFFCALDFRSCKVHCQQFLWTYLLFREIPSLHYITLTPHRMPSLVCTVLLLHSYLQAWPHFRCGFWENVFNCQVFTVFLFLTLNIFSCWRSYARASFKCPNFWLEMRLC